MTRHLSKYYPYPVNKDLYETARNEIFSKVSIPAYIMDNVDPSVNLYETKKMCCPMHEEDTPSFVYNEDKNIWTCYGSCSRSGKVIDLHKILHGIKNYPSAVMHFRNMYGNKYNINFKDFFIYEGNTEVTIDDILNMKGSSMETYLPELLESKERSPHFLIKSIEESLSLLSTKDRELYIKYCLKFDSMFSYHRAEVEELDKIEKEIKGVLKDGL